MRTSSVIEQERRTALQEFLEARKVPIEVGPGHGAAREARMEQERREAVRRREQEALQARASAVHASDPVRPRAVVLHRAAWTRQALCQALVRAGVDVVEMHEDGAAGLGAVIAEQPDLVVVQEQLPWKDGLEVVREVRRFAPSARVAVHLDRPAGEQGARAAGAHAVFPRSTRPVDMVPQLVELAGV
ncbi:MAG: hybrid sensor histidine kinase/response regulator [Frankiales bacterium]|nr:hybrid sensor histidine kinase/response regulator [Frankiales bacterium]